MDVRSESTEALTPLRTYFGHARFREGQEQVVGAVLGGRDVLAVMPTGSGKSLGYQLPAVMLPGTTLVVSPLISLMKDQVDELNRRRIPAGALHSMLPAGVRREVLDSARAGRLRLLYVAPERFASESLPGLLTSSRSHGSSWTRRIASRSGATTSAPTTGGLRDAAELCRRATAPADGRPIAAFTATATPEVRDDIIAMLGLAEPAGARGGVRSAEHSPARRAHGTEEDKDDLLPRLVATPRAGVCGNAKDSGSGGRRSSSRRRAGRGVSRRARDKERTRVQDAFAAGTLPSSARPMPVSSSSSESIEPRSAGVASPWLSIISPCRVARPTTTMDVAGAPDARAVQSSVVQPRVDPTRYLMTPRRRRTNIERRPIAR